MDLLAGRQVLAVHPDSASYKLCHLTSLSLVFKCNWLFLRRARVYDGQGDAGVALCRMLVPRNHSVHGSGHYYFTSEK